MPKPTKPAPKATRNAVETKARILREATLVFARTGYDGAAVSEIVQNSRVNKRMLYHYFGEKKGLYRAVFIQQWSDLKEWFDEALKRRLQDSQGLPTDIRGILSESLGTLSDFMAARPAFIRLLMWEGLEGGEISRGIWKEVRGPIYIQLEFIVRQAQEEGVLDAGLDPAHLIISFLGAVGFYFAYAPTLAEMIHKDPFSPTALKERRSQIQRVLESLFPK